MCCNTCRTAELYCTPWLLASIPLTFCRKREDRFAVHLWMGSPKISNDMDELGRYYYHALTKIDPISSVIASCWKYTTDQQYWYDCSSRRKINDPKFRWKLFLCLSMKTKVGVLHNQRIRRQLSSQSCWKIFSVSTCVGAKFIQSCSSVDVCFSRTWLWTIKGKKIFKHLRDGSIFYLHGRSGRSQVWAGSWATHNGAWASMAIAERSRSALGAEHS